MSVTGIYSLTNVSKDRLSTWAINKISDVSSEHPSSKINRFFNPSDPFSISLMHDDNDTDDDEDTKFNMESIDLCIQLIQ